MDARRAEERLEEVKLGTYFSHQELCSGDPLPSSAEPSKDLTGVHSRTCVGVGQGGCTSYTRMLEAALASPGEAVQPTENLAIARSEKRPLSFSCALLPNKGHEGDRAWGPGFPGLTIPPHSSLLLQEEQRRRGPSTNQISFSHHGFFKPQDWPVVREGKVRIR